jgi:putative DNA primase/helicase
MSAGYVGRFEDGVLQNLYRFDRDIGYYIQCSTDSLVWHLMNVLRTYFPDCTVPATFFSLVENNVLPCLPDIDKLTDSSPEFEAVRAYYVDRELVPFKNGIYSLQDNVLLPRTSFIFVDHPLDVDFDPSALENDIADRFMEMMCNNSDLFELLFEQIGYALYARSFIVPTVTIFYGAGANGKSIVLDLVKRIVGSNNISTLSMYDMTNAFSLASSEGKLLNLSTDSSAGPGDTMIATANTAEFMKKATSGEAFSFNPKHSKPRIGYGPRKFMFATNVMLKFGGIDEGLARRIYAVPFNAKFEEDYSMKVKLTSESTKTWFAMQALISLE